MSRPRVRKIRPFLSQQGASDTEQLVWAPVPHGEAACILCHNEPQTLKPVCEVYPLSTKYDCINEPSIYPSLLSSATITKPGVVRSVQPFWPSSNCLHSPPCQRWTSTIYTSLESVKKRDGSDSVCNTWHWWVVPSSGEHVWKKSAVSYSILADHVFWVPRHVVRFSRPRTNPSLNGWSEWHSIAPRGLWGLTLQRPGRACTLLSGGFTPVHYGSWPLQSLFLYMVIYPECLQTFQHCFQYLQDQKRKFQGFARLKRCISTFRCSICTIYDFCNIVSNTQLV